MRFFNFLKVFYFLLFIAIFKSHLYYFPYTIEKNGGEYLLKDKNCLIENLGDYLNDKGYKIEVPGIDFGNLFRAYERYYEEQNEIPEGLASWMRGISLALAYNCLNGKPVDNLVRNGKILLMSLSGWKNVDSIRGVAPAFLDELGRFVELIKKSSVDKDVLDTFNSSIEKMCYGISKSYLRKSG